MGTLACAVQAQCAKETEWHHHGSLAYTSLPSEWGIEYVLVQLSGRSPPGPFITVLAR